MPKITSLSGVITLPEVRLNFVVHLNEEGPKGIEAEAVRRILDKASGLPPEMQEIVAGFADYLARREEKVSGQGTGT